MAKFKQGPCPCGQSSDAFTVYTDGSYHCFSCGNNQIPKEYHKKIMKEKEDQLFNPEGAWL